MQGHKIWGIHFFLSCSWVPIIIRGCFEIWVNVRKNIWTLLLTSAWCSFANHCVYSPVSIFCTKIYDDTVKYLQNSWCTFWHASSEERCPLEVTIMAFNGFTDPAMIGTSFDQLKIFSLCPSALVFITLQCADFDVVQLHLPLAPKVVVILLWTTSRY